MSQFHNPYQFIPVDTKETITTTWRERGDLHTADNHFIRHDYWHPEGHSGRIHCKLHCLTPLVVGGKQTTGSKSEAGSVKPYRHPDDSLAIPGNSLRGMISSIVEAISQSAMRVLNDEEASHYTVRMNAEEGNHMKLGLLYKRQDKWAIYKLDNQAIRHLDAYPDGASGKFNTKSSTYHHFDNPTFHYLNSNGCLSTKPDSAATKGVLYIRAHDKAHAKEMPKKLRECFIPWSDQITDDINKGVGIEVQEGLVEQTDSTLRKRQKAAGELRQLPKGYQRYLGSEEGKRSPILHAGDLIYYREVKGEVTQLSYSNIWRRAVAGSLHDAFKRSGGENSLPWHSGRNELTPAEALFGVVEEQPQSDRPARNLASRLRFCDALAVGNIKCAGEIPLKILASPKPPSPALYFRRKDGYKDGYVAKKNLDLSRDNPNGRKVYLPHQESETDKVSPPWEKQGKPNNDNWKPHLKCTPIPAKRQFTFAIEYENLSTAELGLLRRALMPGEAFIHRLGLGKPLGLGQVEIEITSIEAINRTGRYREEELTEARYREVNESIDDSLIDAESLEIVTAAGRRTGLVAQVSYPYCDNQEPYPEKEGFKWFESNNNCKQAMEPIDPNNKELPTLNTNPSGGK